MTKGMVISLLITIVVITTLSYSGLEISDWEFWVILLSGSFKFAAGSTHKGELVSRLIKEQIK
jgi:hypothetical protein